MAWRNLISSSALGGFQGRGKSPGGKSPRPVKCILLCLHTCTFFIFTCSQDIYYSYIFNIHTPYLLFIYMIFIIQMQYLLFICDTYYSYMIFITHTRYLLSYSTFIIHIAQGFIIISASYY